MIFTHRIGTETLNPLVYVIVYKLVRILREALFATFSNHTIYYDKVICVAAGRQNGKVSKLP